MTREMQILLEKISARRQYLQAADFMTQWEKDADDVYSRCEDMAQEAINEAQWEKLVRQFRRVGYSRRTFTERAGCSSKTYIELKDELLRDLRYNGYIIRPRGMGDRGVSYLGALLNKKLTSGWDDYERCYTIREEAANDV